MRSSGGCGSNCSRGSVHCAAQDLESLGDAAPEGDFLAAYVPDLVAKEALCADDPAVYFTTPHFDGYPIVLVRLAAIAPDELEELMGEAWLERVPKRLAQAFLDEHPAP